MFAPESAFTIRGEIDGIAIEIRVKASAKQANASDQLAVNSTVNAEVQNTATYIFTGINGVLKMLEMNAAKLPTAPPAQQPAQVVDLSQYRKSLEEAQKGEGD